MTRFSASVATAGFAVLLFAASIPAQAETMPPTRPQTPVAVSKVRIVRLSEVRGTVQLDRGVGHGFEPAIMNMPVVGQNRLKTDVGVAEVEFEDNSTLRLGPYSEVQFVLLGRTAQGATLSTVRLVKGIAYMSVVNSRAKVANAVDLVFGDQNIQLQPNTHVRLEMNGQQAQLAVLKGVVQVEGPKGAIDVPHKRTATFALANDNQPVIAKGVASLSLLDTWDQHLDQYHGRVASLTNFGGVPYSYGASDMLYYGAFQNIGGCGMMWRPYFASAAWDPYANGTWAYYAGTGYSWVSPYPWGWTPYHYGSWSFCPGAGWGWAPGGSWMGLHNIASAATTVPVKGIKGPRRLPVVPQPPRIGGPTLVSVSRTALVHSGLDPQGSFVFRKDSAGLGIPRNELGSLRGFSRHAVQKGIATTPIYMSEAPRASNGMRGMRNTPAPVSIHRGYAPSSGGFPGAHSASSMGSARSSPMSMPSAPSMGSPRASAPAVGGAHH